MFKLDLEKPEEPDQSANIPWIIEKAREKTSLLYGLCQSLCVDQNKQWKILQEMGIPPYLPSWDTCVQVKKLQLELDMEQQTGSKLGKE